jgi:hypothetical protein
MSVYNLVFNVDLTPITNYIDYHLEIPLNDSIFEFYLTDSLFFDEANLNTFIIANSVIKNISFFVQDSPEVYNFLLDIGFEIKDSQNIDSETALLMCLTKEDKNIYIRLVSDIRLKKSAQILLKTYFNSAILIHLNPYLLLTNNTPSKTDLTNLAKIWDDSYNMVKDVVMFL